MKNKKRIKPKRENHKGRKIKVILFAQNLTRVLLRFVRYGFIKKIPITLNSY